MTRPRAERFWEKVQVGQPDGCWEWQGTKNTKGYGMFWLGNGSTRKTAAHRWSYQAAGCNIPKDYVVHHECRNPGCVNPAHLRAISNRDNILLGTSVTALNATKTHCKYGHELTPENIVYQRLGRACRICLDRLQAQKHAREKILRRLQVIVNEADANGLNATVEKLRSLILDGEGEG